MKMFFMKGDPEPATDGSVARRRDPAVIPPFTFSGPLDRADSGIWYPPRAIILLDASIVSSWPGTAAAVLNLYRLEYGNQRSFLGSASLGAYNATPPVPSDQQAEAKNRQFRGRFSIQTEQSISPPTISPFEGLFVQSTVASGHENVVVQVIGEYL